MTTGKGREVPLLYMAPVWSEGANRAANSAKVITPRRAGVLVVLVALAGGERQLAALSRPYGQTGLWWTTRMCA